MRVTETSRLLPDIERGEPFEIEVDGAPLPAYPGDTIAAVLLAAGRRAFAHADGTAQARGVFCGMGVCFSCLVTVDGIAGVRACVTEARPGMWVETATGVDAR